MKVAQNKIGKSKIWLKHLKVVVEKYDRTIFIEEALHRLVEVHYKIGLKDEAKKFANLLGYNYQSSEWYEKSYKIFNKEYSLKTDKNRKKKEGVIKRFKKLFD